MRHRSPLKRGGARAWVLPTFAALGATATGAYFLMPSAPRPEPAGPRGQPPRRFAPALVASAPIHRAEALSPRSGKVELQWLPADDLPRGAIADRALLRGHRAAREISPHQAISAADLGLPVSDPPAGPNRAERAMTLPCEWLPGAPRCAPGGRVDVFGRVHNLFETPSVLGRNLRLLALDSSPRGDTATLVLPRRDLGRIAMSSWRSGTIFLRAARR